MEKSSYTALCTYTSFALFSASACTVAMGVVAHKSVDGIGGCPSPKLTQADFILASEMAPKLVCLHQPWQVNHIHSSTAALMADNGVHFS